VSDFTETIRRSTQRAAGEKLRPPEMVQTGRAIRPEATGIHSAFCKTDAGLGSTIVCYLDVDTTGTQITVHCEICGGTNLSGASPLLSNGKRISVYFDGTEWLSVQTFDSCEDCET